MSEVLRLSWSIARSGWKATYNRTFRFSRMKGALIWLLIQAGFFLLIARRTPVMDSATSRAGIGGLLMVMALQMGWFGLMYGFSRGQFQLYQGILVPLFQITPARPLSFLLGRVIESVPLRAWSCLLWGWVYAGVVPGAARWGTALLLALFGLLVGMVAHLSGLLLLTFWSRYSPKTMRNGLFFFGAITIAMATWAVIFLSSGGTVTELALAMRQYRLYAYIAVTAITGVPGLLLLGALLLRPAAVEQLYREGLYRVLALADGDVARPRRSYWLPLKDTVLRAVLSREWMELFRSRTARMQLMIWVAGTAGAFFAGRAMVGEATERVLQFVGSLSLLAWFLAFGHLVVRVFERERKTILLYQLAAVPAAKLLLAKFVSVFIPSALLTGTSALVGSLAAHLAAGQVATVVAWSVGALAAGTLGGFGVAAATAGEEPEEQEVEAAPRRDGENIQATGNAWWSVARTVALVGCAALPLWTAANLKGPVPPFLLMGVDLLVPAILLVRGVWVMLRSWRTA